VSHWKPRPGDAARLVVGTAEALAGEPGSGWAEALRRSMLALADEDDPRLAHPAAWASFVVLGEGGGAGTAAAGVGPATRA
jgi:hypothetical protein